MQNWDRLVVVDLDVHSQFLNIFVLDSENTSEDIDVQRLAARTREVNRCGIRGVIIEARDLGVAPKLFCDYLCFGSRAEKVRIDR